MTTRSTENVRTAGGWRAWLQPWPEADTNFLVVEGNDVQVRFVDAAAWTIFDMHWRGREVGRHSGATGSVIQWEAQAPARDGESTHRTVGTGHGGEVVRCVTVHNGHRVCPVVAEGRLVCEPNRSVEGNRMRVHKQSHIGPFDHESIFDFSPKEPGFVCTHRYRANDGMARGRFAGYRYTFMFMLPETYDRYLMVNTDGTTEQAVIAPKAGMLLERSFKALACYSPADRTGMVYAYPEAYPGINHINVRPGKDRKFRANLFREHYDVGDVSVFHIRIIPFEAPEDHWAGVAARVIEQTERVTQHPTPASGILSSNKRTTAP